MNKRLGFLIIVVMIFFTASWIQTYVHESAHKQIFKYHGADSRIEFNLFDTSYTVQESPCKIHCAEMALAQDLVEAIGYQLNGLWTGIFLIFSQLILRLHQD